MPGSATMAIYGIVCDFEGQCKTVYWTGGEGDGLSTPTEGEFNVRIASKELAGLDTPVVDGSQPQPHFFPSSGSNRPDPIIECDTPAESPVREGEGHLNPCNASSSSSGAYHLQVVGGGERVQNLGDAAGGDEVNAALSRMANETRSAAIMYY